MATKEELKQAVCAAIDQRREDIIRIGETIMRHPETGFKEFDTARLVAERFEELGLRPQTGLAVTGIKGRAQGRAGGPTLAILGELDALRVPEHPLADSQTGAAHACGHNAQVAGMLGAAMGLISSGALESLAGNLVLFAVPAEEMIEVEERLKMKEAGKVEFLAGKTELIAKGHFDDIDLAMMIHTKGNDGVRSMVMDSSNGALVKKIRFIGKAAHAGSRPQLGINALNAASLALSAIAFLRETFYDDDTVRIHPIITKGGDAVNVVPAEVTLETFVRGKTLEAIVDANRKVDRALRGAAMAIGTQVEIQTIPGYMPQNNNRTMAETFGVNARGFFGDDGFRLGGHRTGSTDMGDVGHIMPVIHPYVHGGTGNTHSKDWMLDDKETSYVIPAKLLAMTAVDLMYGDAALARKVIAENKPKLTRDRYLEFQRGMFKTELFNGDEAAG